MAIADKLELALKALSLSRAGLAAAIGVDKSVAGRWVSGKVTPSSHNLAKISRLIAEHFPDFTMLDWERDMDGFAEAIGVKKSSAPLMGAGTLWPLLPEGLAREAAHASQERTKAYEGFWLTTRPSSDLPGQFLHDVTLVRRNSEGFLEFDSGVEGFFYRGTAIGINQQLYYFAADDAFGAVSMGIFNGVSRHRADLADGVILTTLRDAGASPTASSIVMERIGNLSGDPAADEAKFRELVKNQRLVAEAGSIDPKIAKHLHDAANAPGMLRMLFSQSISRGPLVTPDQ